MVTTRSADKRLDPSREEDLVLRSRRIGSPRSTASTPSQASKRTANAIGTNSSPRVKRSKSGPDDSVQNAAFHVVVNVPVKSATSQPDQLGDESTKQVEFSHDSDSSSRDGRGKIDDHQTTPTSALPTATVTPPTQANETFRTPATSRHKRFDSEEIGDETIVVSTAVDSTATQGYQTAEEEIGDSDDDAPEVQSTRTAPNLPYGKLGRPPKAKKKPQPVVSTPSAVLTQTGDQSSASGDMIDSAITGHDKSRGDTANSVDLETPTASRYEPRIESLAQPTEEPNLRIRPGPDTESNLQRDNPPESTSISDATALTVGASEEFVQLPHALGQDLPQPYDEAPVEGARVATEDSSLHSRDSFSHASNVVRRTQAHDTNAKLGSNANRLPLKPNSSLSAYKKDKMQQKVAGSAGGYKLQNEWSKKRSSFVVS